MNGVCVNTYPRYATRHRAFGHELRDITLSTAGGRQPPLDLAVVELFNALDADVVSVYTLLFELSQAGVCRQIDGDGYDDPTRKNVLSTKKCVRTDGRTQSVARSL